MNDVIRPGKMFGGDPGAATALIVRKAMGASAVIERMSLGLTWTACKAGDGLGFAMSPGIASRVLAWPGSVAGRTTGEVAAWLESWDPFEATVGLAAANAAINSGLNPLLKEAVPIELQGAGNLAVFQHFREQLQGKRVAVVGRYPGLDEALSGVDVVVLERAPVGQDLPDPAAEFVLPHVDWVFLTSTSLINKTFHRLAELSRNAVTVLMGPSTPWLSEWADFGIDILAGVDVVDAKRAECIAMEGGGTRLFGPGVRYAVLDLRARGMR